MQALLRTLNALEAEGIVRSYQQVAEFAEAPDAEHLDTVWKLLDR